MVRIIRARTHNLQDLSVELPQNQLIVLTGVSGSGKSSLAVDTLGAEGIRRFLEGLSPEWRMRMGPVARPDVEAIENLPPVAVIGPHKGELPKQATDAQLSGCSEGLERLFASEGIQHSLLTGKPLRRYEIGEMAEEILKQQGLLYLLAPLGGIEALHNVTGYMRALIDGKEWDLSEAFPKKGKEVRLVIDRLTIKEGARGRLLESLSLALQIGGGVVITRDARGRFNIYSTSYLDGETLLPPLGPRAFRERTPQALACKIGKKNIAELEATPAEELLALPPPLQNRLSHLCQLGLGYLTLDRPAQTLSIGELQRVQLTGQLANDLTGLLLILDEPTRGLHRKDVGTLLSLLQDLKTRGNTLLVVEHEPHVIGAADQIIELTDGRITFQGTLPELLKSHCLTRRYLSGKERVPAQKAIAPPAHFVHVRGASCHSIHNLDVDIPLQRLVAFAGVSGSGKSTLLLDILLPRLKNLEIKSDLPIDRTIAVDQEPLGLASHSLPATAIGLMTPLRDLLSQTPLAKARGHSPTYFSLAKPGGRCERCRGRGLLEGELVFPAEAVCPACEGARFSPAALEITWKGHSPADLLNMTAEEAFKLFGDIPQLTDRLVLMTQLGLGYLKLGQPLPTLSSGEVQRLKLISQLAKKASGHTVYILDEPSSGLHLHDLSKLLEICHQLLAQGHTIWMIEHHLAMIRSADWVIELGPGAGSNGGKVVFAGTPQALSATPTATGQALSLSAECFRL